MSQLFEQFSKSSKEDWMNVLNKELKGADFNNSLIKNDELEGISYPSFFHQSDAQLSSEVPGKSPYTRGFSVEENDWSIVGEILVSDEKTANEKALDLLMKGNTALNFEFQKTENLNLELLFQNIEFQYIKVFFTHCTESLISEINAYFSKTKYDELFFNYNPLAERNSLRTNDLIQNSNGIVRNFEVDAYSIQQSGANCSQEIAFALSLGHEYLSQQISLGRTINEAVSNIHFTFGVGSTYLFEIAKLRAFRLLWGKIISTYQANPHSNQTVQITSKIGFLNKSLQDPYTNLLRQTTEVMSVVLGGVNHIITQAYDKDSTVGSSELAERMASNISLILKEESYLEKVLDAVGGSYAIENLTESLADKAWTLFQENENVESLISSDFLTQVSETAQKRVDLHREKKKTLIGITKFPNPDKSDLIWKENETTYFGLKQIRIEQELN